MALAVLLHHCKGSHWVVVVVVGGGGQLKGSDLYATTVHYTRVQHISHSLSELTGKKSFQREGLID
jgi:hypothetical protein